MIELDVQALLLAADELREAATAHALRNPLASDRLRAAIHKFDERRNHAVGQR